MAEATLIFETLWFFGSLFMAQVDNPLDDGRVEGHVSLADRAAFAAQEEKSGK